MAFGVVFALGEPLFSAVGAAIVGPPIYILSGVWLIPAVLAPLIVRLPGAAILAETMAAAVSALLGSVWGLDTLMSGLMQGAGAELVFALPCTGAGRCRSRSSPRRARASVNGSTT